MKKITLYLMVAAVMAATSCNEEFKRSGVTAVTLSEYTLDLIIGFSANLQATVEPLSVAQDVGWSSSDPDVATVSQSGVVTAVGEGTAYISATSKVGRRSAACTVTVSLIPVTGVTLNETELALLVHDEFELVETVAPNDAGNKNVIWSSDDEDVVSVNALGEIKALFPGVATITVTTRQGDFKATCTVTVTKIPVTEILLSENTVEGTNGDKLQLIATVNPKDASFPAVTWSTSDISKVTVTQTGLISIVSKEAGSAVIKVTSNDDKTVWVECVVTILKDMSDIVETVIWEGSHNVGSWGNWMDLQAADFASAEVGSTLVFTCVDVDLSEGYAMLQLQDESWSDFAEASVSGSADQLLEIVITEEILDKLLAGRTNIGGIGLTIMKISVLTKAVEPFDATLADNFRYGTGYSGRIKKGTDFFPEGDILIGSEFEFDIEFTADRDFEEDEIIALLVDTREAADWWTVKGETRYKGELIKKGVKVSMKIKIVVDEATSNTTCDLHFETGGEGTPTVADSGIEGPVKLTFTKFVCKQLK